MFWKVDFAAFPNVSTSLPALELRDNNNYCLNNDNCYELNKDNYHYDNDNYDDMRQLSLLI